MAEGAIATAIDAGVHPVTLHAEVIAPALRRIAELAEAGEVDARGERLARGITRRVLATLYRYMIGATEATRERVLLVGVDGREDTLGSADGARPARSSRLPNELRYPDLSRSAARRHR